MGRFWDRPFLGLFPCPLLAGRLGKLWQTLLASRQPRARWGTALALLLCVDYSCPIAHVNLLRRKG